MKIFNLESLDSPGSVVMVSEFESEFYYFTWYIFLASLHTIISIIKDFVKSTIMHESYDLIGCFIQRFAKNLAMGIMIPSLFPLSRCLNEQNTNLYVKLISDTTMANFRFFLLAFQLKHSLQSCMKLLT